MKLTQDDVHVCRILFNKDTHAMAIAMYGERAKEIYKYVCKKVLGDTDFFKFEIGDALENIIRKEPLASFFFENNLVDFSCFNGIDIRYILNESILAEKIWDLNLLDNFLWKMGTYDIHYILIESPICEKIWDSGKLEHYLHKLHTAHIQWTLKLSPIADKIKASGKLKLD